MYSDLLTIYNNNKKIINLFIRLQKPLQILIETFGNQ